MNPVTLDLETNTLPRDHRGRLYRPILFYVSFPVLNEVLFRMLLRFNYNFNYVRRYMLIHRNVLHYRSFALGVKRKINKLTCIWIHWAYSRSFSVLFIILTMIIFWVLVTFDPETRSLNDLSAALCWRKQCGMRSWTGSNQLIRCLSISRWLIL